MKWSKARHNEGKIKPWKNPCSVSQRVNTKLFLNCSWCGLERNELPGIGYPCYTNRTLEKKEQSLQVAICKCIAKSCFEVQKRIFTVFTVVTSKMDLGTVYMRYTR